MNNLNNNIKRVQVSRFSAEIPSSKVRSGEVYENFKDPGSSISAGFSEAVNNIPISLCFPKQRNSISSNGIVEGSNPALVFSCSEFSDQSYTNMANMRTAAIRRSNSVLDMNKSIASSVAEQFGTSISTRAALVSALSGVSSGMTTKIQENFLAAIMMPMSMEDTDTYQHNLNNLKVSKVDRSGGSAANWISQAASDVVGSVIDNFTQGYMADNGEQLYQAARSGYGGGVQRQKTFTWELQPRSLENYIELEKILMAFKMLSYGTRKNTSRTLTELNSELASIGKKGVDTFTDAATGGDKSNMGGYLVDAIAKALSNAATIQAPPLWTIQKYAKGAQLYTDLFGPAFIESINVSNTPDGRFDPLQVQLDKPSRIKLSITFKEAIVLDRDTVA